jgi:hypothetical protein
MTGSIRKDSSLFIGVKMLRNGAENLILHRLKSSEICLRRRSIKILESDTCLTPSNLRSKVAAPVLGF